MKKEVLESTEYCYKQPLYKKYSGLIFLPSKIQEECLSTKMLPRTDQENGMTITVSLPTHA